MTVVRVIAIGAFALSAATVGAQGTIVGTVYDSLTSHAPVVSATVVLVELSRYATTDGHGRFRLDGVPAGRYALGFTYATLDALDLTLPTIPVEVIDGRGSAVTLASPSATTMYVRMCGESPAPNTSIIVGRVRDVDDHTPLAEATVTTDWTEVTVKEGRVTSDRLRAAARTNASGAYVLCAVPTHVAIDVSSKLAGFTAGPTSLTADSSLIRRVDFAISRRDSSARDAPADSALANQSGFRGTASLRGIVVGSDGQPLSNAAVGIMGSSDSARTNAAGAFHLDGIPAGTRSVQVRAIGWLPATVSMDFATNSARDTTLSMTQKAQALEQVTVPGRSATSWMELSGFELRRQHALGAYITEQDIAKHNFSDLISVLRTARGLHVQYFGGRGMPSLPMPYLLGVTSMDQVHCKANFFVDGAQFPVVTPSDFKDLSVMLRPNLVRGIEVYSNPGTIPAQYDLTSSTGCGSIVIWTH